MIKGYIFDYGGTIDTAGCHWGQKLWHSYKRHNIPVTEQQFRDAYVYVERALGSTPIIKSHYTFHKTLDIKLRIEMEYLMKNGAWNATEEEFHSMHGLLLEDVYGEVLQTVKYSGEILSELKKEYPMVLVSNFYGNINVVLEEFRLKELFSDVIESAVVGIKKPDSRIFTMGVEALKMDAKDTVVVGDSYYKDIVPAHKAGCNTIWFKGQGWTDEQYDETVPDRIITDLAQLLNIK